ncbi:WhiB family transcriptional regulator [Promicromonospora sp. NPDC060271]|uniref:WhiB family transcriptional regulator n=1 Tax=Promicromonospora sp. NPDC060271 TaxID=3347089 RepID=UPI00366261AA
MSTDRLTGAACARPVNVGLPWISENPTASARADMARVCASCPVAAACAREVASKETTAGFWAGADRNDAIAPDVPSGRPVQGTFNLPGLEVAA